jgi:hypothetical protein
MTTETINRHDGTKRTVTHVVTFVSRNKDNVGIGTPEFPYHPRTKTFAITYETTAETIEGELRDALRSNDAYARFVAFASSGLEGETSRAYVSLNAADPDKCSRELTHRLIDGLGFADIERTCASIAASKQCAATKRWLFDADCSEAEARQAFLELQTQLCGSGNRVELVPTLNNWSIICEHGFDCREFCERHPSIELKRADASLFIDSYEYGDIH